MTVVPTISIAMCTYNGEAFLPEQLDSILNQRYRDWELVVVDDCSSDGTREILERYAARDRRISVYYNDQNLGYNKNFEKSLGLCRAELIAICDQDDVWHEDKLQKQAELMGDHQLMYHDSEFIDGSGKIMNRRISDKMNLYRGSRPEAFLFLNCVSGHSILMRKGVFEKAAPFPADFHYDQWLAFNAACLGSIDFVPECLVSYRQHSGNNTDILALHPVQRTAADKITALEKESHWLMLCARQCAGKSQQLLSALYNQSVLRNKGFFNAGYGLLIWKHRDILLHLLKKSNTSKFFYTLRKMWGPKAKMIGQ